MKVFIPSPLRSYTGGRSAVEASGATVAELLLDLESQFKGFRFRVIDEQNRIRQHIRIFINTQPALTLDMAIPESAEIDLICAISGG
jgi:molybdopterin converting factor small subunit